MSGALGWLTARWFRRRWPGSVPILLLVAVGTTGTVVAASAAHRTSHAYADYLERADVADLVINPSINTRQITDDIAGLPGVERMTTEVLFKTTLDEGAPRTRAEIDQDDTETYVFGSADGRYVETDRPIVLEGRMPRQRDEAVVNADAARAEGWAVGDVVPVAFFPMQISDGLSDEEYVRYTTELVQPLGVERVRIVGVVRVWDEVLPDDLYPRQRLIVSSELSATYSCLPDEPPAGTSLELVAELVIRSDCAVDYRYHALQLADGADGVAAALEQFFPRVDARNAILATYSGDSDLDPPLYFPVVIEPARERERVEHASGPIVAAAWIAAAGSSAITLLLLALLVARELRRTIADQRHWHRLGVPSRATGTAIAVPMLAAVALGAIAGVAVGWCADQGSLGLVAAIEPDAGRRLVGTALLAIAGQTLIAAIVVLALTARSVRRASRNDSSPTASARRVPVTTASPVLTDSIRSTYGSRTAPPVIAGIALLVATTSAALVVGNDLDHLLDSPDGYGWPWDTAVMVGGGYGGVDAGALDSLLADDPAVDDWTVLGFTNDITVDAQNVTTIVEFDHVADGRLTLLEGRLPRRSGEVALGIETARRLGRDVGDVVDVDIYGVHLPATVTGLTVFPALGPLFAERTGSGNGMLLAQSTFDGPGLEPLQDAVIGLMSFVGVDLVDDSASARARVDDKLATLGGGGSTSNGLPVAIRPPEIIDANSTRDVPFTVAVAIAAVAAIGLAVATWASVRARQSEISVLRTLGFDDRQVRRSVRVQALATTLTALVIGVPLGVVTGRTLWRAFAEQLGVVPDSASPALPVVFTVVGGLLIAMLAAQFPAAMSTRALPSAGLRSE